MPIIIDKSMSVTRAMLATSDLLSGLQRQIRTYMCEEGTVREVLYATDSVPYVFYEVAEMSAGSWWLPTGTEAGIQWQGSESLRADGNIPTAHILRPRSLLWWVPAQALDPYVSTVDLFGKVHGRWPADPPPKATS